MPGPRTRALVAATIALLLICAAAPVSASRRRPVRVTKGMREVQRVFVVVLENTDAAVARQQPFLAELAARGAYLDNLHAITHPSRPNYLALLSGSTWGVGYETDVNLDVRHLGNLLEEGRRTWRVYAEDYPGGCFLGETRNEYVRRHVGFLDFRNVQTSPARCANVVNATQLASDVENGQLADFSLYVPNLLNDGHDTGAGYADSWLQWRFESLLKDPAFMSKTLFIVMFDEATSNDPANLVYAVMLGSGIQPGVVSRRYYDLYSVLRTIEEIFFTRTLGLNDASAPVIDDVWKK